MTGRSLLTILAIVLCVAVLALLVGGPAGHSTPMSASRLASEDDPTPTYEPEPTRDYSQNPTITPSIQQRPTTDPADGLYVGWSAADVAEALRVAYGTISPAPVSTIIYADVGAGDGEKLGLSPEQITEGSTTDVVVIMAGSFSESPFGFSAATPTNGLHYVLLVVDRIDGAYFSLPSDNLVQLMAMLP
jgi:hypothetical protein